MTFYTASYCHPGLDPGRDDDIRSKPRGIEPSEIDGTSHTAAGPLFHFSLPISDTDHSPLTDHRSPITKKPCAHCNVLL